MTSKPIEEHIAKAEAEKLAAEAGGFVPLPRGIGLVDAPPPLVPATDPVPPNDAVAAAGAAADDQIEDARARGEEPNAEPEADRELTGKRVVLIYDAEYATGWKLLVNPDSQQGIAEPLYYEGDRDGAPKAALDDERNAELADLVRADPDRFYLVGIPASSWAPAHFKPRVTKTTWTVVR